MLKLIRRPITEFLGAEHQAGLRKRAEAAATLAADPTLSSADKSKRVGERWDAFRAGRASRGTFEGLWCELRRMAFDKCALCETPGPGTVEHLKEKSRALEATFDWPNLLPACDTCNRTRENSGVQGAPLDPSADTAEPLDYFGWDAYGDFAPSPQHLAVVRDLVRMYGLHRLREERSKGVKVFRALLAALVQEDARETSTVLALRAVLTATSGYLGPIREYLLRPPTDGDGLLIQGALLLLPELRLLVEPWLRPPAWAPPCWR